ncbi:MAG: hypothetical protein JXB38_10605 [Anaerolineales bacterium]|nr:hypothetical protein [Anaerolineales bacterium]
MLKKIVQIFGGDPNQKAVEAYTERVNIINSLEAEFEALSDDALAAKTAEFKQRLADGETLDDLLHEAFAVVRETSKRQLGMRHHDTQLIGGMVMHEGKIAEMRTGEGKTLTATLAVYLNALTERGVHLVTVNDYLARRDARWMTPIYGFLGMSVGVLQMASRTEHGKKAFMVDLSKESPHEDQHQLEMVLRKEAYAADITYGTNNEFGFDYLRDNMGRSLNARVQRGHNYAIIDEVDNVLIDEARTPLIISGPSHDDTETYIKMADVVKRLKPEDYEVNEKDQNVILTEIGEAHVESLLGVPLRDPDRPEDITPEQARLMGFLEQALRAQYLYRRNKEYLVQGGQVIIIDEGTGRLMPGRRWSNGLHQAVEAKENVRVQSENVTYATVTIQNYYRLYEKLSGMTGTALTEAEEFSTIYELEVIAIPPYVDYMANRPDTRLQALQDTDEYNYKYTYYANDDDSNNTPVFWARKDYPDVVYRTVEAKLRAIVQEIIQYHLLGRPILVGTTSVESSDRLSNRLRAEPVRRLAQVLLLRDAWFKANDRIPDGRVVMALSFLNEPLEKIDVNQMRQLARDLEVQYSPENADNVDRLLDIFGIPFDRADALVNVLKGGVPHQVLNARKHTEESKLIAGAGRPGAVTIATNMAGRGVDIKLGGEVPEEVIADVNRILRRSGVKNYYDMSLEEKKQVLQNMDPEEFGIFQDQINTFIQAMDDMVIVKQLGGLHVIGSERHEARRIDNQLRGRAARLGDPGSSRFFLSMEDDLMRLFGGQQVDNMMQRMGLDDALPLEHGIVSRVIEQSQTRVEGANFDTRKHLLDYDDVLNDQRKKIYAQRDIIFTKKDLSENVREMLEEEIGERVPQALEDEDGPWRLLSWLNQIQPSFSIGTVFYPSFTTQLLLDHIKAQNITDKDQAFDVLVDMAEHSLLGEQEHFLRAVNAILDNTEFALDGRITDKYDTLDTFFQGLYLEEDYQNRAPRDVANQLAETLGLPLNLSNNQQRLLLDDEDEARAIVGEQLEDYLTKQAMIRLIGSIERRMGISLDLTPTELADKEWENMATMVLKAIEDIYTRRQERLVGEQRDGMIATEVKGQLNKIESQVHEGHLLSILMNMPHGTVTTFDKKTHQRMQQRTVLFTYVYYAAEFLEEIPSEEISERVLKHLEGARVAMQQAIGIQEWALIAEKNYDELNRMTRNNLKRVLGKETVKTLDGKPLGTLPGEQQRAAMIELGRQTLTEVYRDLILRVISDLWIDYLTQMEALRVSIGLEAYAQRDPLVQYKTKAFEMFQQLFKDMRQSVVNRMFTSVRAGATTVQSGQSGNGAAKSTSKKSKKKRRRRR